jgi:hypothetical protein
MSETEIILQVLRQFREDFSGLAGKVDQTVAGLGEVRENQRAASATLDAVLRQTTLTNGRVSGLEDRVETIERREIREDARADGRREQREAYWRWTHSLWEAVWSTPGRIVGALALLSAGWTLREIASLGELWPW